MDLNYDHIPMLPLADIIQDHPARSKPVSSYHILFIGGSDGAPLSDIFSNHNIIEFYNYREAAYHLRHLPTMAGELPDAIMGNSGGNSKDLGDFIRFLHKDQRLVAIPFILIRNKTSEHQQNFGHQPIAGVDDVVREEMPAEELTKKIALLKKFKSLRQHQQKIIALQKNEIPADRRPLYKIDAFFKRVMDILISVMALVILLPVLLAIAIIIKIDSRGPVFYTSYRAGSRYCIFKFIKFRTMVAEADHKIAHLMSQNQYGANDKNKPVFFKVSNDPRITRFGKFLRNSSLDEIPQLFNVLKGDMSLVGNRPLPLYEAKTLTTDLHAERFNAPAGITGLWQISKRGQKDMSVEDRITLDINYARHNSFVNDFQIMLKTPKALIQKDNV